ncbi:MAG: PQQ-binding-like beta-propeller repeat protein, partial [Nitrospinaceae bacterium]|nr:PQQ-binding-like beta-propeller repeat protein [Nitrospinaceae bacterium]NIR53892.1 PQQ-binding-like beta-propeller repeat protein [Nitrospinaceae bacterium]NIS84306.1 PQQ-binding-like beta-propeller repeat protein [Nitrospinaceae bacterium]NIT81113.1 PQQ-binding-like beta-propeller repeat protein [Nitrospinaceae bacterium]NIU43395.1 PQQ-binding-like beta-propeller repeat protein [Nitrospinaceae bacterium]
LWEKELPSPAVFCRVDRRGNRVIVGQQNGMLSCFKFLKEGEQRTNFLELTQLHDMADHREIWSQPIHKVNRSPGTLKLSGNGRTLLLADGKEFQLYDSAGSLLWVKHFMTRFPDVQISRNGKKVLLSNPCELFLLDTQTLREKHLTFYSAELKEVALAPSGTAVLAFDQFKTLTCYSGGLKTVWSRTLKKNIKNLRIHNLAQRVVFQTSSKILFVLNLDSLKLKSVRLGSTLTALQITADGIFAGGLKGRCYGMDINGRVRWRHKMEGPVEEIIPLTGAVAFRNRKGALLVCDQSGREATEYVTRHSGTRIAQFKKDILELVATGDMLSCYKVASGDLVWKLPLAGRMQSLAVSATANRMAILDSQSFHYHQLVHEARAVKDRSSFLEL